MPSLSRVPKKRFFNTTKNAPNHPVDYLLMATVLGLLIFGLIMITSIGVPKSIHLSAPDILYPNCSNEAVDCYLILKNHATRLALALLVFVTLLKINYQFWKKISLGFFALAFGLLVMVLFFGSDYNTFARSWIHLPNFPLLQSVQPTEIAKLALIFYFANWLDKKQQSNEIQTFHGGFLAFAVVSGFIILPIILQPDLGSTLVTAVIASGMYFVAGANWRHILLGILIAGLVSITVVSNVDYLHKRFISYLSPTEDCAEDSCWQSLQAKIAVGSGGIWGRGLTQGIQKSYWLPQASDDFIFAASSEEIGFSRIIFVVLAYVIILYRGLQIANYAPNTFARLTAAGITLWITGQAFINIAVNIAIMPVTGVTLPFVSYGGSSLVMSMVAMAVLLNISQYTTQRAYMPEWRENRFSNQATRYRRR
ncbi:MAG: cell division protein FtsW, cell division protein FtsW [Candidatus Peregrinibacteria bacterium GW2011_GWE2_39_6]|nr:MAG: cell division protein FtsW, cell division protein FtsW [Candidatus Peregrinibacteria bacterium GW2011_GWF2_39_17]KKR24456.1 MAG: cell division protein FtsW, cell division protein FtsW [Candidatus Peregrinibacteria bacterium GW2011_GWE2_39_6]